MQDDVFRTLLVAAQDVALASTLDTKFFTLNTGQP
jgi:hypothetical protein